MFNKSGEKYLRPVIHTVQNKEGLVCVDIYSILEMYKVEFSPLQHAAKKILCAGLRDKGTFKNDITEAKDALERALQMIEDRTMAIAAPLADGCETGSVEKWDRAYGF